MKTPKNKYLYIQEWKKRNPRKVKQAKKRWYIKNKDRQREWQRRWREKHPDYYKKRKEAALIYERNKLIYQARTIQGLTLEKIGKMFKGKGGKPMTRERIRQIVDEYQRGLDLSQKGSIIKGENDKAQEQGVSRRKQII